MLPIKKIYIDTKYKSRESVSNSNFKINLPQTLTFPDNSVFYIDDISIPHSWYTIEENINDKLYVYVSPINPDIDNTGVAYHIVTLTPGLYNGNEIVTELQIKLNASFNNSLFPNLFITSYNSRKNTVSIAVDYSDWQFKILTDNEIYTKLNNTWLGENYDINNNHSANDIIGNNENNSRFHTKAIPYVNVLNLQPIRNIYIHSSLGNYNTWGARNETSIVKKIPVTSAPGDYIFNEVMTSNDFGDCSKQTLRTLEFQLKNVKGDDINFHGSNLSFSIIFSRMNPEL